MKKNYNKKKDHKNATEENDRKKDYKLRKRYLQEEEDSDELESYNVSYRDKHDKLY